MIVGTVNARYEVVLRLKVLGPSGAELEIEAVVDTGYTTSLTLPPQTIAVLKLKWDSQSETILGDGTVVAFDTYHGSIVWNGVERYIFVQAADTTPLVGTRLLAGHDLRARFEPGGQVEIEAIP